MHVQFNCIINKMKAYIYTFESPLKSKKLRAFANSTKKETFYGNFSKDREKLSIENSRLRKPPRAPLSALPPFSDRAHFPTRTALQLITAFIINTSVTCRGISYGNPPSKGAYFYPVRVNCLRPKTIVFPMVFLFHLVRKINK